MADTDDVEPKAHVFISYSRKDGAFAEKLRAELLSRGFDAFLDKEDILPGEPWRQRLEGLILASDSVVFVISPDSVASEICQWEVQRALDLEKVLTPLFWREIPNGAAPDALADRNWVFFDLYERSGMSDEAALGSALEKLEVALKIADKLWVRDHRKWVARAVEWETATPSRPEGKLLPPGDSSAVEAWVRLRPVKAPDVPAVLSEYLRESIAKSTRDAIRLRRTAGRAFVKPAQQALDEGAPDRALRLAAAGAILADDIDFELVPELWPLFARAAFDNRLITKFDGHEGIVASAAISPDGKLIATTSYDKTVRLWDPGTGAHIRTMEGHTDTVWRARFHPAGGLLVSESSDDTVRLWDIEEGKELLRLDGIHSAISPEGRRIAIGMRWGGAYIVHLRAGAESVPLKGHEKLVTTLAFSPDGTRLVTASYDKTARIWNAETGEIERLIDGHTDYVWSAEFSPDGRFVLTASEDDTARIWGVASGTCAVVMRHDARLSSASFSRDGKSVVTASHDKSARVWNAETGAEVARLIGHTDDVRGATFSRDAGRVVTWANDRTVRIWDARSGQPIARFLGDFGLFSGGRGESVVTTDYDSARIWDARRGYEIARLDGEGKRVRKASFSPSGDRILTVNTDNTATVWRSDTGEQIVRLEGHVDSVTAAKFSPDGTRIVTTAQDRTGGIWDPVSGAELARLDGHADIVNAASFSPDGNLVVTASDDKTARLFEVGSGREIATFEGHEDGVTDVAFSPDATLVVTASKDKTARVWDVASGGEVMRLVGHAGELLSASFSPDGERVLTASAMHPTVGPDQTVRLWSVETGRELIPPQNHGHRVVVATFDHTGTRVLTASMSQAARVFDAATGTEIVKVVASNALRDAMFSPDGSTILTGDDDGFLRLWHVATGAEIARLKPQNDALCSAACDADGTRVVTAGKTLRTVDGDQTAVISDMSRAPLFAHDKGIVMAAVLAAGVGHRTKDEAADLLLQDAPDDLFAAVCDRLGDRAALVQRVAVAFRAGLHPNCYLGFSQFADRFVTATDPEA